MQQLDMKQTDVTVYVSSPSYRLANHDPLEVKSLKIIASQIFEQSKEK